MSINNSAKKLSNPRLELIFFQFTELYTHKHWKDVVINYAYVGIVICTKVIPKDIVYNVGFCIK